MKLDDIQFVINDINKQMPLITNESVRIPFSATSLPKNLSKVMDESDNKFLNNHLTIVEEISNLYPNHPLPVWMQRYHNKYFKANLIGDGFFKTSLKEYRPDSVMNVGFLGSLVASHVNGADLQFHCQDVKRRCIH